MPQMAPIRNHTPRLARETLHLVIADDGHSAEAAGLDRRIDSDYDRRSDLLELLLILIQAFEIEHGVTLGRGGKVLKIKNQHNNQRKLSSVRQRLCDLEGSIVLHVGNVHGPVQDILSLAALVGLRPGTQLVEKSDGLIRDIGLVHDIHKEVLHDVHVDLCLLLGGKDAAHDLETLSNILVRDRVGSVEHELVIQNDGQSERIRRVLLVPNELLAPVEAILDDVSATEDQLVLNGIPSCVVGSARCPFLVGVGVAGTDILRGKLQIVTRNFVNNLLIHIIVRMIHHKVEAKLAFGERGKKRGHV
mmetsp:Transcript_6938/g.17977  ORF Transcript_6938/g.17977 Transcript_6938/m.17977 type:complete len:304 (-) Transcript_6938:820-1731(-)